MSKLFFLFCSIFGCRGNDFMGYSPRMNENVTGTTHFCTAPGRFPNPLDVDCQSYISCYHVQNDEYITDVVPCSNGTVFNVTTERCSRGSRDFICPHICEEIGIIPYRKNDCQQYVLCDKDFYTGKMNADLGRCPNGTWFCGELKKCLPGPTDACVLVTTTPSWNTSTNWTTTTQGMNWTTIGNETTVSMFNTTTEVVTQNPANTTDPWTNTSTTVSPMDDSDNFHFTCNQIGRFPLPGICNQYILCVQGFYGEWIMSLEKCPKGRVFSTTRSRCVII